MYYHRSIEKYTIALLDLFNDIKVQRERNQTITNIDVPLRFGQKNAQTQMQEHSTDSLETGNLNSFPRMSLVLEGLSKNVSRAGNKFSKIHVKGTDTNLNYVYNSVPYDFNFNLVLQTITLTDASNIIEQITSRFNPSIKLGINEIEILNKSTTVNVLLEDVALELPEDWDETRIIEVSFSLTVQGNMYLPISDSKIIKEIELSTYNEHLDLAVKSKEFKIDENTETVEDFSDNDPQETSDLPWD